MERALFDRSSSSMSHSMGPSASSSHRESHSHALLQSSKPATSSRIDTANTPIESLTFDELCGTTSEWRNIQEIVRNTLRTTFELVQQVGSRLREMERTHAQADRSSKAQIEEQIQAIQEKLASYPKTAAASYAVKEEVLSVQSTQSSKIAKLESMLADMAARMEKVEDENMWLRRELDKKASFFDVQTLENRFAQKDEMVHMVREHAKKVKKEVLAHTQQQVSALTPSSSSSATVSSRELVRKADIEDVSAMLDTKADAADVQTAVQRLARDIDARVPLAEFQAAMRDQAVINEALCAQLSMGRWLWTSRKLKSGHGVPWNLQVANTDPENFRWEPDRVNISIVAAGLYEMTFGFFAKHKPTLQVHVNGEPVMSAVNSASYVVHHSSGRLTETGKSHPAGNVTGLTCIDFLSLPANAKVAISFAGELDDVQGFLSLRKL